MNPITISTRGDADQVRTIPGGLLAVRVEVTGPNQSAVGWVKMRPDHEGGIARRAGDVHTDWVCPGVFAMLCRLAGTPHAAKYLIAVEECAASAIGSRQ